MDGLLKFITCGSVDDGKSTLIGHMLYDAKLLFADQEQSLQLDSKAGSAGGEMDYSLLLDGLMAEREQGITIDVAYRYFTTNRRSFIVADTPGHEEYTRNMAVGASFADLAVILVDATKGVLIQTKRHTRICALMGIRDFVFVVNKMDLIHYGQQQFESIEKDIRKFVAEFPCHTLKIIPVSATVGDSINSRSDVMAWYHGETLLEYLEQVETIEDKSDEKKFCMPVQRTCRPHLDFRGFQGQIESGNISKGDKITVLPSGESAHVERIYIADQESNRAVAGQPVTLRLDREIDISRGCVLTGELPCKVSSLCQVKLLWMDDDSLYAGKNFILKLGTRMVSSTVMKISYKIDINSGERVPAEQIFKNEIAVCEINTAERIVMDKFENNKVLGGFILIDRITNMTSACGTVEKVLNRSENVTWQELDITKEIRAGQKKQNPLTLWFTGLSGSGKSTLVNELEKRLVSAGYHTMVLDGDNIRLGLNKNLGFSRQDRIENIRRISEVAKLMNDAGLIVLTSFISPFEADRQNARGIIGEEFVEVYVSTPIDICEKRDVKGLYKKARKGEIPEFTGISSPYEVPEHPDISVDTSVKTVEENADEIMEKIQDLLNGCK
ncbi:MAG: adenylyl-sulfate kinase [Eubacterium sp.]|nr:adenylyl-sulfate kinase [Eubacterium sp.]